MIDELAAADLHQLGHPTRHYRQVLALRGGSCPVSAPRSKTQCASEPSQRARAAVRRSAGRTARWTLTIGDVVEIGLRFAEQRAPTRRAALPPRSPSASDRRAVVDPHAGLHGRTVPLERPARRIAVHPAERLRRQHESSPARRPASSAVCTVKIPIAALASAEGRFSAGRMKTSQNRSIARRSDWTLRDSEACECSSSCTAGSSPRSAEQLPDERDARASGRCAYARARIEPARDVRPRGGASSTTGRLRRTAADGADLADPLEERGGTP